jgi:ABC-type uncharacterized transport system YnjBCD substrate-binding protein
LSEFEVISTSKKFKEETKMSFVGALTVDDFLVSLSNIQSENFAKLQQNLIDQSSKLDNMRSLLVELRDDLTKVREGSALPDARSDSPLENPFAVKLLSSVEKKELSNFAASTPKRISQPSQNAENVEEEEVVDKTGGET